MDFGRRRGVQEGQVHHSVRLFCRGAVGDAALSSVCFASAAATCFLATSYSYPEVYPFVYLLFLWLAFISNEASNVVALQSRSRFLRFSNKFTCRPLHFEVLKQAAFLRSCLAGQQTVWT